MSRGGIGSASIVLIFVVVCLTIFTVVSFVTASTEEALINTELQLVREYYEADALAEQILAEILSTSGEIPESIRGIEIYAHWDWDSLAEIVAFVCPVSDVMDLYVVVAIRDDSYEILVWRMYRAGEWEADDTLNVWQGFW